MHMADALLSPMVGGTMYAVSTGAVAYAVHRMKQNDMEEKKLPMMAVSGAFVFAAQMINFSIPATGSSGHIGGGILLAGLLGGTPALLTIAAVLVIQCLFFADGGLLALGANIFNMGVVPCLVVYPLLFRPLLKRRFHIRNLSLAAILSSIVSLQLGAFSVVLETLFSGVTELPFTTFLALMQPIHLAIGIVEGAVTAAVLGFVYRMNPDLIESSVRGQRLSGKHSLKRVIAVIAVLAVLLGAGLSWYASSNPDGLEWSMERVAGTAELSRKGGVYDTVSSVQERTAILPDYDFSSGEGTGTSVSGVIGALLTCVLVGGTGAVIVIWKKRKAKQSRLSAEEQ